MLLIVLAPNAETVVLRNLQVLVIILKTGCWQNQICSREKGEEIASYLSNNRILVLQKVP